MTDYVKSTNFTSKDSLPSGNALKIIKGTEFDIEFNNIATSISTKADSSVVATKADASAVNSALDLKAPLASPTLTGTPTAPTAAVNTNTTQVATTAFVVAQIADDAPTKTGTGATGTWGIDITGNAATATTVADDAVTKDKLQSPAAGSTYTINRVQTATVTSAELTYFDVGLHKAYSSAGHLGVTALVPGTITCSLEHAANSSFSSRSYVRILKNGVVVTEWMNDTSSFIARTVDVDVVVGDAVIFQHRQHTSGTESSWRSLLVTSSNPSMAVA